MKIELNTIKIDHIFQIIHIEYLIIGGSGPGKTNLLLNLINNQPDIDKIYLYAKDRYEVKYQFLINKRESTGLKHFNDPKAFIECSNDMHDVYKNIDDQNPDKDNKILIKIQKEAIKNLENFYLSKEEVINFFADYIEMLSDANYDVKQNETKETGLKILTLKQMLQRLPIAFAQVKAGNNSESLLNEIRKIGYSLYQSKQITKKVYNNIITSI